MVHGKLHDMAEHASYTQYQYRMTRGDLEVHPD